MFSHRTQLLKSGLEFAEGLLRDFKTVARCCQISKHSKWENYSIAYKKTLEILTKNRTRLTEIHSTGYVVFEFCMLYLKYFKFNALNQKGYLCCLGSNPLPFAWKIGQKLCSNAVRCIRVISLLTRHIRNYFLIVQFEKFNETPADQQDIFCPNCSTFGKLF